MRNSITALAIFLATSLTCEAGNLVFEAQEEEEIIINAAATNKDVKGNSPDTHSMPATIRCQLPNGQVLMLTSADCKAKAMSRTK